MNIRSAQIRRSAAALLVGAIIVAAGCSIRQPGSPRWETELTVPIADRFYSLSEIVADSTELDSSGTWVSNAGDALFLNLADSLEKMTFSEELQYDEIDEIVETYVGVRTVNAPGTRTTDFHVLDSLSGATTPLPPFSFGPPAQPLEDFTEYDWAYVSSGNATITVTNNLPVPVENLNVRIYNQDPYYLLLEMIVTDPLDPGASTDQTFPLPMGVQIDNRMEIQISGNSPGSADPVSITANDNIQTDIEISTLEVTAALAHYPAQSFSEDTTYTLDENDTLKIAIIKDGTLGYTVTNGTELITSVTFTLPDLTLNEVPFSDNFELGPNGTYSVSDLSLEGYQLSRPDQDNLIHALVWVDILDTADPAYGLPNSFVYVDEDQLVNTHYTVSELYFSFFEGTLDNKTLEIEQEAQYIEDIPGGLDSLEVESAEAQVHLSNVIGAPVEINLTLLAFRGPGIAARFEAPPLLVPPGSLSNPGTLDTIVTGLEPIVSALPDSILPTGESIINGPASIEDWQWIEGRYVVYSPFSLSIGQSTLEPDITIIDEGFKNRLNQVDLALYLENHIPLNGEAMILASYDSTQFGITGSTEVDTFLQAPLPQATLTENGYVMEPGISTVERTLNYDQLEMFANADSIKPLFIQTLININSTNGDTVRFRPWDHVTVGASAHMLIDIDLEDGNGGG